MRAVPCPARETRGVETRFGELKRGAKEVDLLKHRMLPWKKKSSSASRVELPLRHRRTDAALDEARRIKTRVAGDDIVERAVERANGLNERR